MIDSLPLWFWFPTAIILWSALAGITLGLMASAPATPYPDDVSRLDVLDGVCDRTEVPRHVS